VTASDTLYGISPFVAPAFVILLWIASKTSTKLIPTRNRKFEPVAQSLVFQRLCGFASKLPLVHEPAGDEAESVG